jgi:hypothetical protein
MQKPMPVHFSAAPWPKSLKLISTLGTILILAVGISAYLALPIPSGFAHLFGLGIALVLPSILGLSLLFMVTGYAVEGSDLYVKRLFFSTRIALGGLSRVSFEPGAYAKDLSVSGETGDCTRLLDCTAARDWGTIGCSVPTSAGPSFFSGRGVWS